jgi:hypothetical protein
LTISLVKEIPEAMKPKSIAIGSAGATLEHKDKAEKRIKLKKQLNQEYVTAAVTTTAVTPNSTKSAKHEAPPGWC